ncbi:aminotransferase [Streptomyces sp. A7024]|uniref:Aminotransferase n=1 Tax=Streptomyces coryli TaxID=1128680 RepID=A0A6G4TZ65_9ACTN|nr:glycogen debranching N-terminal domain-containing protein [Streptomyces coryli]NGN65184.1 aminotransferase [Streptomyces coryli]
MTSAEHRHLFHGGTFAAIGPAGDITGARAALPDGLFIRDARHLSRWQLTVDGATPEVLVPAGPGTAPAAESVLTPASSRTDPPAHTLFRELRVTAGALLDRIRVVSNRPDAETVRLALTVDADFADQFELRGDHRLYEKPAAVRGREVLPDGVEFRYRRRDWHARTVITADPPPAAVEETGSGARRLVWELDLEPHGSTELNLRAEAHPHDAPDPALLPESGSAPPELHAAGAPPRLARACRQGLADLSGLLIPARGPDDEVVRVPAAGVPWFLALFGRHALLTSLFALPHWPAPATATLLALAATQATEHDPARSAQPGKIVHEVRHGELAHFGQVPYGRYYGSVDATPLFLVLLGEVTARTGDDKPARRLERHARAAVDWMLRDGGLEDRGYLYYRADEGGLANQSWKDSPGAICYANGERARGAVAAAAPQGYAYAALRHAARLARTIWDDEAWADRLTTTAAALRARFVRDFWLPDADFPALALDGDGTPVDALGSDAGHLLWSGLLEAEQARRVGRRLLEPDFFSGWGVRTLAAGQAAYHPLSYHRGSVWPHDNAMLALGLAQYGMEEEARVVANAVADLAAASDNYRLPEVIAGYPRTDDAGPVPYPHACSPQSWSAAAPLALLTAVA